MSQRSLWVVVISAISTGLGTAPAVAQQPAPPGNGSTSGTPRLERRIESGLVGAEQALAGGSGGQGVIQSVLGWLQRTNSTTIQGAQLAQRRASSSKVKQLASSILANHGALQSELATIASARGIQLPGTARQSSAATGLSALSQLKGSAFDKAFLTWLSARQRMNAKQAQSAQAAAHQAGDPALSSLVGKLVPLFQSDASSAQALRRTLETQRQARRGSQGVPARPSAGSRATGTGSP